MAAELMVVPENEVEKVRSEVAPVLAAAQAVVVTDEESYRAAMELGQSCASRAKRVEEVFKPARESTHRAWKAVTELIASFVVPLESAKKLCTGKAVAWQRAEEARRAEEVRKAQEAERKRAEGEAIARAVALEAKGKPEQAAAVLAKPVPVPVVAAPVAVEAPKGATVRSNWQAEVTDLAALVKAVADGAVGIDVLDANMVVLRKIAKDTKGATKIPGVHFWDEGTVAFRGR